MQPLKPCMQKEIEYDREKNPIYKKAPNHRRGFYQD